MRFLSTVAGKIGIGDHAYIVGGAVRNWLLGDRIKDLDVAIDVVASGVNAEFFARALRKAIPVGSSFVTNQYGVAILTIFEPWTLFDCDMKGETIEIAGTRKESYGGAEGKGYKPHLVEPATIEEDLLRREFTFNTLLWRLSSLGEGPENAEVLDLLGRGRSDLENRLLRTPRDPDQTFLDDPTRMLRAIKFMARYGFHLDELVRDSIIQNAGALKRMPWDALRKIVVEDILLSVKPRESVRLIDELGLSRVLVDLLKKETGFNTGLSRGLAEAEPLVLLDLLDLGWPLKLFLAQFSEVERTLLREYLVPLEEGQRRKFVASLNNPPVDKNHIFEVCSVPVADRGMVAVVARQLLVRDPSLMGKHEHLAIAVEREVKARLS